MQKYSFGKGVANEYSSNFTTCSETVFREDISFEVDWTGQTLFGVLSGSIVRLYEIPAFAGMTYLVFSGQKIKIESSCPPADGLRDLLKAIS